METSEWKTISGKSRFTVNCPLIKLLLQLYNIICKNLRSDSDEYRLVIKIKRKILVIEGMHKGMIHMLIIYTKRVKACSTYMPAPTSRSMWYIHALILLAAMLAITSTQIDWYDVIAAQATIHD